MALLTLNSGSPPFDLLTSSSNMLPWPQLTQHFDFYGLTSIELDHALYF